jgi:hypothetical protein
LSPILVRPVREQLEHDRVIRLLQQDLQKKKVEVGINPGYEQNAGVGSGTRKEYPDAVVYSLEKGKRVMAVVEVETGESVNDLEAKAQWAHLARLRVPFHLYVPMGSVDVARRLSADNQISVSEIWSYHQVGEQFKFTLIYPAKGKGAQAPRTVSVSTIRVPILDPDSAAPDEAAPPPPAPTKSEAARGPRVVPVKSPDPKAKGPAPKVAPAVKPSASPRVGVPAKVSATAKVVPAKARPAVKAPAKLPPKAVVRPVAKVAKPTAKPAKPAPKAAKPAPKPAKAAARKPAGKRK